MNSNAFSEYDPLRTLEYLIITTGSHIGTHVKSIFLLKHTHKCPPAGENKLCV